MTLGARILLLREQRKWTQVELAQRANVSQPLICKLERPGQRQNVHSHILKRLAQALGCTTDYLVGMYEPDPVSASASPDVL